MGFLNWDKFDKKMKDRAMEELLRFMALFTSAAALVCFFANLMSDGDMTLPFVLLTFMMITMVSWQYKKRKNDKRWGHAVRTGKEIFRIGMSQPGKEEPVESKKKTEKSQKSQKSQQTKKKSAPKGNYKR